MTSHLVLDHLDIGIGGSIPTSTSSCFIFCVLRPYNSKIWSIGDKSGIWSIFCTFCWWKTRNLTKIGYLCTKYRVFFGIFGKRLSLILPFFRFMKNVAYLCHTPRGEGGASLARIVTIWLTKSFWPHLGPNWDQNFSMINAKCSTDNRVYLIWS